VDYLSAKKYAARSFDTLIANHEARRKSSLQDRSSLHLRSSYFDGGLLSGDGEK
jgi:hypothetical protein